MSVTSPSDEYAVRALGAMSASPPTLIGCCTLPLLKIAELRVCDMNCMATPLPVMRPALHRLDVLYVEGCHGEGETGGVFAEGGKVGVVSVLGGGVR